MNRLKWLVIVAGLVGSAASVAQDWNPADPEDGNSVVDFTVEWAKRLRGFSTLEEVQRSAMAKGKITHRPVDAAHSVAYGFRGRGGQGKSTSYMQVNVYKSGAVVVTILTDDNTKIELDNKGRFDCGGLSSELHRSGDFCPDK